MEELKGFGLHSNGRFFIQQYRANVLLIAFDSLHVGSDRGWRAGP